MIKESTPFPALKSAVAAAGGQSAMARICGVSQAAVWKWLQSGKRLPAEHVLAVERATGVSRHLLRPDIYPTPSAAAAPATDELNPGEDCAPILLRRRAGVACDRRQVSQRKAAR